ncbi:hypothetical protein ANO11243_037130 [Dothideomycetidae sp. 11243]|nr:hypothetical protein ANO11243_037130 [fungal sp. No.11243]
MQQLTPGTAGLTTPSGNSEANDYFGLGIAVTKDNNSKAGDPSPLSPTGHAHYTTRRANFAPTESPNAVDKTRPRNTKDKRERDKKSMLSKALEKANTAVLLDNAQNFGAALDAYNDACMLLEQVMDRTTGPEDRAKLDAIRNTYATRMEELTIMQHPDAEDGAEKRLPPRPESNTSDDFVPQLDVLKPVSPLVGPASANNTSAGENAARALPPPVAQTNRAGGRTRDSFLTDAIREVEGTSATGFLGPLWERSKSPMALTDEAGRLHNELHGPDAPPPLTTPNRTPSPQPPTQKGSEQTAKMDDAGEPNSWLNTIDESDSDSASVHSGKRGSALRRRDLSNGAHKIPTDFDTAFDEAVEAAYEDGYEPYQGDEEQQMMDDIAKDYMDQDFNFNPKSLSSLPLHRTGTTPNPGAGATPKAASNFDENRSVFPRAQHQPQSSTSTSHTTSGESSKADADITGSKPSGIDGTPVMNRRRRAPSTASRQTERSRQDFEVTPWEAAESRAEVTPWETQAITQAEVTPWETQTIGTATPSIAPSIASGALKDRRNRLSNGSMRPLTIETASIMSSRRKRAPSTSSKKTEASQRDLDVTPWETAESRAEVTPWETHAITAAEVTPWETQSGPPSDTRISKLNGGRRHDRDGLTSVPSSALSDSGSSILGDISSPKSRYLRSQKSSISLRETLPEVGPPLPTPTMTSFPSIYAKRNDSTSHLSQKSLTLVSNGTMPPPLPVDGGQQGGFYLFDTTLGRSIEQPMSSSPRTTKESAPPAPFEPCPDSNLLRPFWLLRSISNAATHPRGAYLTTRLFMPHEAWLNRSAKLKNIEDKIAACDMLTAALAPLDKSDAFDANSVLEELQKFEEVMERVQSMLVKKLGSEVGVSHANSMFKEADKASAESPPDGQMRDPKNAAKFSWRKLRGKGSVSGVTGIGVVPKGSSGDSTSMFTVPMTSFSGVEKKSNARRDALRDAVFEGPHKEYMASVARLCEAAQVIGKFIPFFAMESDGSADMFDPDQIARQVEDPGLKHSSTTHVGLEFSTRHAAEFFGFYVCRFLLADIGMLIDKHVKRSTEWILS